MRILFLFFKTLHRTYELIWLNFNYIQDTAVHEQRLNYLRAHISELNRRITSLMESSEHGFPTHCNLQVINIACKIFLCINELIV